MQLTLQIFQAGIWHDAASLELDDPTAGINGASRTEYDIDYFTHQASIDFARDRPAIDLRALSVCLPVTLEHFGFGTWPSFLLDLLPQGHARRVFSKSLGINPDQPSSEVPLLMRSAGCAIGNIRIKEAHMEEKERLRETTKVGVTRDEILQRTDKFMEVVDHHAMIASGSSGLQGEWPKIAMTKANDGLWYPDSRVADQEAREHVIVKLQRGDNDEDQAILAAEHSYLAVAGEFGLRVHLPSVYRNGVLVVRRFDRSAKDGVVVRHGQESIVSAIGISAFAHLESHETYLATIRNVVTNPIQEVQEYVMRDVLNLAMGNPDNHGRNTAMRKRADGGIQISPVYDFAPMKLSRSGIARSTKWRCMTDRGRDHNPDWNIVCEAAAGNHLDVDKIKSAVIGMKQGLGTLPNIARRHGIQEKVIEGAINRHHEIADSVSEIRTRSNGV